MDEHVRERAVGLCGSVIMAGLDQAIKWQVTDTHGVKFGCADPAGRHAFYRIGRYAGVSV